MTVINTNVQSLIAKNALTVNNRALSKAMNQLSTGYRINNAGDDAAGLAVSQNIPPKFAASTRPCVTPTTEYLSPRPPKAR